MKITVIKNDIIKALQNATKAVATRSTISALEGILLVAKDKKLTVVGYDLEMGISAEISSEIVISEPGEVVVSAKILNSIISKSADAIVNIETEQNNLKVTSGRSKFQIATVSATEYPSLPTVENERSFTVKGDIIKNIVNEVSYCTSDNMAKPIYTGVLFEISDNKLNTVAIDGYRMSKKSYALENCPEMEGRFVVPAKTLRSVSSIFGSEEKVTISFTDKHLMFASEGYTVISRMVEGNFLNVTSVIPNSVNVQFETSRDELLSAVERMAVLNKDGGKITAPIVLEIEPEAGTIILSTSSTIGKAREEITNLEIKGTQTVKIGFNVDFLMDALKAVPDEKIRVNIKDSLSPLTFSSVVENADLLHLIVPMRINNK